MRTVSMLLKHKLVLIFFAVTILLTLFLTLPLSSISINDESKNLYVNGRLVGNPKMTNMGFKNVSVSSPQSSLSEKRIFILPFQTYFARPNSNNQSTQNILSEAGVSTEGGKAILDEKYFINDSWLVVRIGNVGPDELISTFVVGYQKQTGRWQIIESTDNPTVHQKSSNLLPPDVYKYASVWNVL